MTHGDGAGWVEDALAGLVTDGTITQAQADAVATTLEKARPERGPRGHRHLEVVAEVLGLSEDEVRTALQGGQTIAERVADGDLTQEQADEKLAGAGEHLTAVVEGEARPFRGGPGHRGGR